MQKHPLLLPKACLDFRTEYSDMLKLLSSMHSFSTTGHETISRIGILLYCVNVLNVAGSCRVSLRCLRGRLPLPFV